MTVAHPRAARGRPQDDELTAEILDETRRQLSAVGYSELRIERIAAAVGCGKTAIYRRWPNKGDLVAASMNRSSTVGVVPDSGSLVDDLIAHAAQNIRNQSTHIGDAGFSALIAPEVRGPLWNGGFMARRREMGRRIVAGGVARGELPADADADAILDAIAGFVLYRRAIRPAAIESEVLRGVVVALVSAPPLRPAEHRRHDEVTP